MNLKKGSRINITPDTRQGHAPLMKLSDAHMVISSRPKKYLELPWAEARGGK
jgi:hypothetical protein